MGTATTFGQLLKGVCHNTRWNYAVFWKHRRMELIWEDVHFDNKKSGFFVNGKPGIISFGHEIDAKSGASVNYPIYMAVTNMSCCSYQLGEGIIGQVASQWKHQWISFTGFNSISQEEFPEEWNHQFVAGIKTILLVPIMPLGVVQLGSLDLILEDLSEVSRISNYFDATQKTSGPCISSSPRIDQLNSYTPSVMPSQFMVQPNLPCMMGTSAYANESHWNANDWNSTYSNLFSDCVEEPSLENIIDRDKNPFSAFDDELKTYFPTICRRSSTPSEHFGEEFCGEKSSLVHCKNLSFPSNSELHKALGISSNGEGGHFISKANDLNRSIDTFQMESRKEREAEQLLDAMITQFLSTSDDNESHEVRCRKSCSNSSSKCSNSCITQCKTEDDALDLGDSMPRSCKRSILFSDNEDTNILPKTSIINNSLITEQQDELHKKDSESNNVSRRRGNARGHKPKPRDRQLIQDRIKELRDLIPDGSKCSIDALLDRTVKHMMFLQSIPCHAEKLRHSAEPKVDGNHWDSSKFHTNQREASQSNNLGHSAEKYPFIVENLDQPGQILVEMKCEDYGLFLEMAQVIRRLKLTILKGILETKSNKPRAQFVLEAPRGFHRMDILWPLVQLLQHSNNGLGKKTFY